ncbi:protein arginine methyltransferase NDUFAF7, mitochondrial [Prorops nasuta]|uniref:protein arginine methyltransferase NDUFAF7, mitochondrial n=1 Tax=Prorops nasuta TaxID=863751 RepID=UPI0034CF7B95
MSSISPFRSLIFFGKHCRNIRNKVTTSGCQRFLSSKTTSLTSTNTPLFKELFDKIQATGPISIGEYMKICLTHPDSGYYMQKDVFGAKGDFTTSPEITPLFSEMLAIWIISEWQRIGSPKFQLVELGPGRGTLTKNILKIFKDLNECGKPSVHFVEISLALAELQAKTLGANTTLVDNKQNPEVKYYLEGITNDGIKIYWYESVEIIPQNFSIILAHEFFDALPVHKFQKSKKGWDEILVDVDKNTTEPKFRYVLNPTPDKIKHFLISENEEREHVEVSPESLIASHYMSKLLCVNGGFALIIDYGHFGDKTDTFRSFKEHKQNDPLTNCGAADLTADVDFKKIKQIAESNNLVVLGPITQREFLKNLGIDIRLEILQKSATEEQKKNLQDGYHMVVDEDKMGGCFKVMALFPQTFQQHFPNWSVTGFTKLENLK